MIDTRLVVISNRLPVAMSRDEDASQWKISRGDGGLVSALSPVLAKLKGVWIGWTGTSATLEEVAEADLQQLFSFELSGLPLTDTDIELYYRGFSNEIIWPLFHGFLWLCNFEPRYWTAYEEVNEKFAQAAAAKVGDDDFLWIHDYHLMLVRRELLKLNVNQRAGFFLHIPFPSLEGFQHLPWRAELLNGLLLYDVLGFQTARDMNNFLQCVETYSPNAAVKREGNTSLIDRADGTSCVGVFPISIDFDNLSKASSQRIVIRQANSLRSLINVRHVMLGIDRLDYTKGIPDRLRAFADALQTFPEMQRNITLIQVVIPSRTDVPQYQEMKGEIERLVGEINGRFSTPGWVPIHYMYRNLDHEVLWSQYLNADIALITPLRDGMNLVAKEFCACNVKEDGVLVLSEFAGAAEELAGHALLVNPHDIKALANAIHQAFLMPLHERKRRMRALRKIISQNNVFNWFYSFLEFSDRSKAQVVQEIVTG